MESVIQDLRYGVRMLAKRPLFAAGAVLSLAFALGANGALFNAVDQLLLKPLPVRDAGQLVSIYAMDRKSGKYLSNAYTDYTLYRDHATTLSDVAAYVRLPFEIAFGDRMERVQGEMVTGNYFDVLGLRPRLGRTLTAAEDVEGGPRVIVISEHLWTSRFNRSPAIVGQAVNVTGHAYTVVGVAPASYKGTLLDWTETPDVWVPLSRITEYNPAFGRSGRWKQSAWLMLVGRLTPDATRADAQHELSALAESPANVTAPDPVAGLRRVAVLGTNETRFFPGYRASVFRTLTIFFCAAGLVLLLACANVATLQLERGAERQREISVRAALGGTRARIVRQLLIENLVLALAGSVGALAVAYAIGRLLSGFPAALGIRLALDAGLNTRVLVFTLVLTVVTTVLFGTVPSLQWTRGDLASALKESARPSSKRDHSFLRSGLIVFQVAVAFIVLTVGAVFLQSVLKSQRTNLNLDVDHVLLAPLELPLQRYDDGAARRFFEEATRRVKALPGVETAGLAMEPPVSPSRVPLKLIADPANDRTMTPVTSTMIDEGYLAATGLRLIAGRNINAHDTIDAPRVALANEAFADRHGGRAQVVNRAFGLIDDRNRNTTITIVGVVANTKYHTVWEDPFPYLYVPIAQRTGRTVTLLIRPQPGSSGLAERIRAALADLDPRLAMPPMKTWREHLNESLAQQRMGTVLLGLFGAVTMLLAALGLYSVLAYRVAQRTQEIGIRLAIGAEPHQIVAAVVRQGLVLTAVGTVVGIACAAGIARWMAQHVAGLETLNLMTVGAVLAFIATIAFVASVIPAQRAKRVDPVSALRTD